MPAESKPSSVERLPSHQACRVDLDGLCRTGGHFGGSVDHLLDGTGPLGQALDVGDGLEDHPRITFDDSVGVVVDHALSAIAFLMASVVAAICSAGLNWTNSVPASAAGA